MVAEINDIINQISSSSNSLEKLEQLYRKIKEISFKHYVNGEMTDDYRQLQDVIWFIEHEVCMKYICDVSIEKTIIKNINKYDIDNFTIDEILNYIVNFVRSYLINDSLQVNDFDNLDTANKCYIASICVDNLCCNLGINSERITIVPGYLMESELFDCFGFHHLNFINIRGKKYLIDCTYKQFFKANRSSLERLGIPGICPPNVGTFMLLNNERKMVSDIILKKGWIEATDDILKHYFDGFTISFRNGLYYEKIGRISYETNYNATDYIRFLTTNDSQLNYEDIELLGYQMKPLKDYRLNFKIK